MHVNFLVTAPLVACVKSSKATRGVGKRGAVSEFSEVVGTGSNGALRIEENGINVITEGERKGEPRQLFWPWFGANVSVLGLSYGAYILGFGISFWQGLIVGLIGIIVSFVLCGIIATAGKRGSAPTMVLSRAAYGVRGNRLPSFISWLLCVGWETVLTAIAIVAALIFVGGVMGFHLLMRMQAAITVIPGVLSVCFIVLTFKPVSWH